jgi:hypothetical protein
MTHYPADSTDARELRDRAADNAAQAHDPECSGWQGEDAEGRPVPCPVCRPHLARYRRRLREKLFGRRAS